MAQKINIGNQSNDGTGDSIREAFRKVNENFTELYGINNLGDGLFFTKLKDTPADLNPSSTTQTNILVVDYFGNTLTQKLLVAGQGITINNTSSQVIISNPNSSLNTDQFPQLGGNLDGANYRGINFSNPVDDQDLATKDYVDNLGAFSRVNLFVSLNGTDAFPPTIPRERWGKSLNYAFRTINRACQEAEIIINTSTVELSVYRQFITLDNGNTTATVFSTAASPIITGGTRVSINYGIYSGTDQWIDRDIRPGQFIRGRDSETVAFIDNLGQSGGLEFYDVRIREGAGFVVGEPLEYTVNVPKTNITILVETGIYEEQLPIRVPTNTSIRGDEFRRVIIRPAPLESTSKWAQLYFRRDTSFDGLTRNSNNGTTGLAPVGGEYGYHYLTSTTNFLSTPKLNQDMDVFLMNDATILRAISVQGHGGFMCVLDPEGQILTKSPYIQNCSSFSRSLNKQIFAGGIFVDGFAGNLKANPTNAVTYFTGTLTVSVTGLVQREPQTPFSFYVLGNRYQVDFLSGWTSTNPGPAVLNLNPRDYGGIAYPNGTVTVSSGGGTGYSSAPAVVFSQPSQPGGYPARGTATISAGAVISVTITNPGSGYDLASTATIFFVGGNPITPADPITVPLSRINRGFIGVLPATIELGTAGNKSMLSADFTQINDLGYGFVTTNNGLQENVSDFTYYNHVSYYAANGGQIRSLNGSTAYGNYGLKAEGADPNEVPIPVYLSTDMVQTATVVSGNLNGVNTVNTSGSTAIYVRNFTYEPYNQCEIEINHGSVTDNAGNIIGVQTYQVNSVNTVSNTVVPNLVVLNLSAAGIFGGTAGGLKAPVNSGTIITIRSGNVHRVTGINAATLVRPSTALVFGESNTSTYRVLSYDNAGLSAGDSKVTLREQFKYVDLVTYTNLTPTAGDTTIRVFDVNSSTVARINGTTATAATQLTFAWAGAVYRITYYDTAQELGQPYGRIRIDRALGANITNPANTSVFLLRAGLRTFAPADITVRISTMRASNHDMLDVGSGSYEQSNYPNDIFGPSNVNPTSQAERVEVGKGRVFAVTTDQDGNFRVGDFFQVDQGTGDLTFSGNLSLTQVDGLGFKRGVPVREFSPDDTMQNNALDSVPTERAVVGYVNKRLGLNQNGVAVSKLGSGYLDLTGLQSMAGSINMAGNAINMNTAKVLNLTTGTVSTDATNKDYVDGRVHLDGVSAVDPSGSTQSAWGRMRGRLQLYGDPQTADDGSTAATKRYVDRYGRMFTSATDVQVGPWPNLPRDGDFLMFSTTTLVVNTTSATPVWTSATVVTNVRVENNTGTVMMNKGPINITTAGSTASVWFSIRSNTLTNVHIWEAAAITQSKLSMNSAATAAWSGVSPTQANLGLAQFNSTQFNSTGGFISIKDPTDIIAKTAHKTTSSISASGYLQGSSFDGSSPQTWKVEGTWTSAANTIVVRDSSQNFIANQITASLNGVATCADNIKVDNSSYTVACTGNAASTIVARDANCDINFRCATAQNNITAVCFIGLATCARYADLAEKYVADAQYGPCTVLQFGGLCEVTIAQNGTRAVAGVVSTNPAYLMNSDCEGEHVVALALQGRVPCKVRGPIKKGDLLIAADDGFARSDPNPKLGTVLGKSLEDFDGTEGIIEIVVGRL